MEMSGPPLGLGFLFAVFDALPVVSSRDKQLKDAQFLDVKSHCISPRQSEN